MTIKSNTHRVWYNRTQGLVHFKKTMKALFFQGEKAYSCPLCGTRFTYRNGLIKHTKLNRCPKKIFNPDREKLNKKKTKSGDNVNKLKGEFHYGFASQKEVTIINYSSKKWLYTLKFQNKRHMEKSAIDKKIIDIIQKRSSMKTNEQGLLELSTAMASVSSINGRLCSLCSLVSSSRMETVSCATTWWHM